MYLPRILTREFRKLEHLFDDNRIRFHTIKVIYN